MKKYKPLEIRTMNYAGYQESFYAQRLPMQGRKVQNDSITLMKKLAKAGDEHAKAMRGIIVWAELSFGIGFMVELDTYNIGVQVLSTSSTMHNELRELSGEDLAEAKQVGLADKYYTRVATFNYQALRRIYNQRKGHRHPDWQIFCNWIEKLPYFEELLKGDK